MTIKLKLILSTLIIIVTAIVIGSVVLYSYKHISREASLSHDLDNEIMYLQMMLRGINEAVINDGTPSSIQTAKEGLNGFERLHNKLHATIEDPEILSVLHDKIDPSFNNIKRATTPLFDLSNDFESDEVLMKVGKLITITDNAIKEITVIADEANVIVDENSATSESIKEIIAIVLVAVILVVTLLSLRIYSSVAKPIAKLTDIAKGFHEGDLSITMDESGKDEFGMLAKYFNTSTEKLRRHSDDINKFNEQLQKEVDERNKILDKLKVRTEEVERVNRSFVGRELKMKELKKEIEELKKSHKT